MYLQIPLQRINAEIYVNEGFLEYLIVSQKELKYLTYSHHKKKPYLQICYPFSLSDKPIITLYFDNVEVRNLIMSSYRPSELYIC